MKNDFFILPRRLLVSSVLISVLGAVSPLQLFAERNGVHTSMQQTVVKGQVLDSSGEPIIGASVLEKGTTNGTITDFNGNYSLTASSPSAVIVFSYIGCKTVSLAAHDKHIQMVILAEDSELLDEVVVVGYGTQKKETLTGSVTVVNDAIFKDKGTVANPLSAMQGQVPGLVITRSSAAPGEEGWGVSIRGAVSKNSVEPLLIIDGVPASSVKEMSQLNSNDIESINFLKDASAAIYGAKAAGGVILVTTKRPDVGKAKVDYSGSFTRKMVGLQPRLMSAEFNLQMQLNSG